MKSVLQARNTRKSKWRIPGGNSSPNRASIISSKGDKFCHLLRRKKTSKAWHCKTNQTQTTRNPPVKKKSPVPAQSPQLALPPGPSKQTVTPKRKSATAPRASSAAPKKKGRSDSAATTPNVDNKADIIELKRLLRESESDLQSAKLRVGRLQDREEDTKKAYEDALKKMQETTEDYDDLAELKRATYNHFLSKWENDNSTNQGDDITPLKNAFPLTLRKYFLEDIEKDKNSLD